VTTATIVATLAVYAALAYARRWISDDGLIVVRTARQILAGHGPVFNAHERAEACTSPLWTWLVAGVAFVTRADVAHVAVALGGVLAVGGLAIAIDAARRRHRARGWAGPIVPAGALVIVALPPCWDFATSGLETGLVFAWLACVTWILVTPPSAWIAATVIGLGPLVRPELALVSIGFAIAAHRLARPSRRRAIALACAAAALPLAYELFRAGYYGTLVPLPALAKSAGGARWVRGAEYAADLFVPYLLFVPLGVFAIVARRARRSITLVAITPVACALACALYIVRVGGDFMHARLLLPALFLALAPIAAAPLERATAPGLAIVLAWAIAIAAWRGDGRRHTIAGKVGDERVAYVAHLGEANPIDDAPFIAADAPGSTLVADALRAHRPALVYEAGWILPIDPARTEPIVYVVGRLGTGGAVAPLDGLVVDTLGLANPLGARITPFGTGGVGHEKQLPWWWTLADVADPAHDDPSPVGGVPTAEIRAARRALTCGALAELRASTRDPLTWSRFWDNVWGSWSRTTLEIPADALDAERAFCD